MPLAAHAAYGDLAPEGDAALGEAGKLGHRWDLSVASRSRSLLSRTYCVGSNLGGRCGADRGRATAAAAPVHLNDKSCACQPSSNVLLGQYRCTAWTGKLSKPSLP